MNSDDKTYGYVSEFDQFSHQFDCDHPQLSQAQQKEKNEYQRIYALRDHANPIEHTSQVVDIWKDF